MYALLYFMMNGYDRFYPPLFEIEGLLEYTEILSKLNIPESSELYRKSMQTLYGNKPNESIGDSLFELLKNVKKKGIDMVLTFAELASKDYSDYGAIFIGGGNTYKLLKGIKEFGAFEKIKEYV